MLRKSLQIACLPLFINFSILYKHITILCSLLLYVALLHPSLIGPYPLPIIQSLLLHRCHSAEQRKYSVSLCECACLKTLTMTPEGSESAKHH